MLSAETNIIFHGGLARERELLRADFSSVLREVCAEDLTHPLGLAFLGQRHGGAAWQAGNCLVLIRRVSPTQTEARLVMYTGAYPDTNAKDCWYALLRCWGDRD